jgi:hypothetical protein
MFQGFHALVTGHGDVPDDEELGKLAVFSRVSGFPVRVKCATLSWHTLNAIPPVPLPTLRGRGRHLMHLGSRPLGEVLFTDPHVRRGPMEAACIQVGQRLHRRAFGEWEEGLEPIWGRRSLFRIDDRPLLVCEIFLPDLPASGSCSRPNTA